MEFRRYRKKAMLMFITVVEIEHILYNINYIRYYRI